MKALYILAILVINFTISRAQDFKNIVVQSTIDEVQPMTGIVFWQGDNTNTDAISLEYSYMLFNKVVKEKGEYNWKVVDDLLEDVASRNHQAILRFRYTYVGYNTSVPDYIKNLPDYHETKGKSEGETTWFPDWSHKELQDFTLDFYSKFADRYDNDPRLAFVQVGFGLWAEYHIYDGPFILGKTFPSKSYQERFFYHLDSVFNIIPWSISIDAADDHYSPLEEKPELLDLRFGNFDDSFMAEEHPYVNALNWKFFGKNRYINSPAGGEFSYYTDYDQEHVLDLPNGAHGVSYEESAKKFHISYIIGNDQPGYQSMDRIKDASLASGYKFQIVSLKTKTDSSIVVIKNVGIAPIYYDAYPAINFVEAKQSLKGLAPDENRTFYISSGGEDPNISIECSHILQTQKIGFYGTNYSAINKIEKLKSEVYPTMISNDRPLVITVESREKTILNIFDIRGKLIYKSVLNNKINTIETETFPYGILFVKLDSENKISINKVIKNNG